MRLLCLCAYAPAPTDNGDAIRVDGLLRALTSRHEVRLVTTRRPSTDVQMEQALRETVDGRLDLFDGLPQARRGPIATTKRWLTAFRERVPPWSLAHKDPAIAEHVERIVGDYDGVVLLDNAVAVYWRHLSGARRTFLDVHHVAGWTATHAPAPPWTSIRARVRFALGAILTRTYERRSFATMDGITVTSADEADRMEALYGRSPDDIVLSGMDAPAAPLRNHGARTVGWLGALTYAPNRDGLIRFVTESWQPLGDAGHELLIAGADAPPAVCDLARYPGVQVLGFVEVLDDFLRRVDVAVVPLWAGAGVKLKTVAFLAAGIPVASTTTGVEGLSVDDGEHVLIRDDPSALAVAVQMLLADPELADRLGAAGRELALDELSWSSLGNRFARAVERTVAGDRVPSTQR